MARMISIKKHSAFGLSGITVMSRFKKDSKLEIHLHFFWAIGFWIHYINLS